MTEAVLAALSIFINKPHLASNAVQMFEMKMWSDDARTLRADMELRDSV